MPISAGPGPSITICSRKGQAIPNTLVSPEDPRVVALKEANFSTPVGAKQLSSYDSTYNCMGMVFASRRTYIDSNDLVWVLRDDDYREIDANEARIGDVVTYHSTESSPLIEHIGWVALAQEYDSGLVGVLVHSKWGRHGEYIHPPRRTPVDFGTTIRYWRLSR